MHRTRIQHRARRPRYGNAAIELAVTLPMMATIIFGSVEVCSQIYTKQAIESAAYECARVAISSGATEDDVEEKMEEILKARNIKEAKLKVKPDDLEDAERGERITIRISAPAKENSMSLTRFIKQGTIEAECVMIKEL